MYRQKTSVFFISAHLKRKIKKNISACMVNIQVNKLALDKELKV